MFDGKAEQIRLFAHPGLPRRRRWRSTAGNHLAGNAAGGIGRDQQNIGDANLLRRRCLQRGEQGVRRGVRTGQEYPSQPRNGEKKVNAWPVWASARARVDDSPE